MQTIDGLEIPESHVEFAKAIAEAADKYGIDRVNVTYRPSFHNSLSNGPDRKIYGDMKIQYSQTDGRGRPCRNLDIQCEAVFSVAIESHPESSN